MLDFDGVEVGEHVIGIENVHFPLQPLAFVG